MRTREELQALAARITYKDGYRISFHRDTLGYIEIMIQFDRPDTYTGEMGVGIVEREGIDPNVDDGSLYQQVIGMLLDLEQHECREAFQVDGERVFGPHMKFEHLLEAARKSREDLFSRA